MRTHLLAIGNDLGQFRRKCVQHSGTCYGRLVIVDGTCWGRLVGPGVVKVVYFHEIVLVFDTDDSDWVILVAPRRVRKIN